MEMAMDKLVVFITELSRAQDARLERWKKDAGRYNVFAALGVERKELRHSAMLAHLLNPRGFHDQGILFLRPYLELFDIVLSEDELSKANVHTEYVIDNQRRLDIVIFLPDRTIAVENKVDAGEQTLQVQDYQECLEKQ